MRALLLQRETKLKRQAKIKSRKYRRHLKQQKQREKQRSAESGVDDNAAANDDDDDDDFANDVSATDAESRREIERARLRMTQRHAKSTRWLRGALKHGGNAMAGTKVNM